MKNPAAPELLKPLADKPALRRWLQAHLGLSMPDSALCPGHDSPLDYAWHSYHEPASDCVVWAPRGGGKTRLAGALALLDLLHKPGISVRVLGGSLDQSLRVWEHLVADLQRLVESDALKAQIRSRFIRLANGSTVAAIPQSQRAVRGLRVQKLRCDEVELFDPDIWEAAQLVTQSRELAGMHVGGAIEALSTHHEPAGLMHRIISTASARKMRVFKWNLLDVLENCPDDRDCDTCVLLEECGRRAKNRTGGFFRIDDAIRMKQRVSLDTWQTEMLCLRPATRGSVFPSFDPDIHCADPTLADHELFLAIDFGFAAPFVCLWIRSDRDGVVHVIDEYLQQRQTIDRHIGEIQSRTHGPVAAIFCDPAGGSRNEHTAISNIEVLERAGYRVRRRASRIVDGLELIRAALSPAIGNPRLFFHPRCRHLLTAMQSYRYPDTGEIPIKDGTHDHPIDALRYFFVNRFAPSGRVEWKRY